MSIPGVTEFKYAIKVAQDIIVKTFTDIKEVDMWFTGGAVREGSEKDYLSMNFRITYSDNGIEKLTKDVPDDLLSETKTTKEVVQFALLYLAQHIQ